MNWLQFQNKPALFTVLIFCDGFETALSKKINYLATDDGACIIPQDCEIKDFTESRSYMETTIVGDVTSINHGNSLDFACKENRTLSESKDPDADGLFNVVCYNGVLERQYLWPESNEVHTI